MCFLLNLLFLFLFLGHIVDTLREIRWCQAPDKQTTGFWFPYSEVRVLPPQLRFCLMYSS